MPQPAFVQPMTTEVLLELLRIQNSAEGSPRWRVYDRLHGRVWTTENDAQVNYEVSTDLNGRRARIEVNPDGRVTRIEMLDG